MKLFASRSRKNASTTLKHLLPSVLEQELLQLKEAVRRDMPDNPCLHGHKTFSQNDEDGIIQHILGRIPENARSKTFIEIGCGDGLQNNTHLLAVLGYKGYWVDGSEANIAGINLPDTKQLKAMRQFVDKDNLGALLKDATDFIGTRDIDFFTLDIDGNDLYLAKETLKYIQPKVICVEYNAKFAPPIAISIPYNPTHAWAGDDYHGASLQAFVDALPDYRLVCCNLSGVNAFFVHQVYAAHFTLYPVAALFQPPRYRLGHLHSGHPASRKWLKATLTN